MRILPWEIIKLINEINDRLDRIELYLNGKSPYDKLIVNNLQLELQTVLFGLRNIFGIERVEQLDRDFQNLINSMKRERQKRIIETIERLVDEERETFENNKEYPKKK